MIIRLQHVGLALSDLQAFEVRFDQLFGLKALDRRQGWDGSHHVESRIMLPNELWLQCVENSDPKSRVARFIAERGEGLEHISLETDNIEEEVAHLREVGVHVYQDRILDTPDGLEAVILPDDAIGFAVELIQPHLRPKGVHSRPKGVHSTGWQFDASKVTNPNVRGLQHIGVAVGNVEAAAKRFERLFRIKGSELRTDQHYGDQRDVMVLTGNDRLWLHLVETTKPGHRVYEFMQERGEGLEHLSIEVADIRQAVRQVASAGVALEANKIYLDRADGFEAFVMAADNHGITVELIEPYPTSRGYRPNEREKEYGQ